MPPRTLTSRAPHIGNGGNSSSSNTNSASSDDLDLDLDNLDNPFNDIDDNNDSSNNISNPVHLPYGNNSYDDSTDSSAANLLNSTNNINFKNNNNIGNTSTSSNSPEIKQHSINYKSSSFRDSSTSSSLLNPFSSSNRLSSLNNLNQTAEYNRYPKNLSNSRINSMNSFNNNNTTDLDDLNSNANSNTFSNSDSSSNPFMVDTDFSPFGGYPTSSFPLLIDEKEDDDYLHNPDPIEEAKYEKHRVWNDLKSMDKKSSWTLVGLLFFLLGGIGVFVILPALTYTNAANHHHRLDGKIKNVGIAGSNAEYIDDGTLILTDYIYPQLSAIRTSLIDPDTPSTYYTRKAKDGSDWQLVFSDEFAAEGRTFYEGDDQFWYAPNFHYDATKDLEWYDPDAVTTANGTLNLRMDAFKNHDLFYRSGMLHSWNRMCFTQGIMEVSARLPNYGNITGLWPGLWSMGNLGRPGYMATTDGVWPYAYNECDAGITPNQSSPDGINYLPGQRLNKCTCPNDDHPNPGVGRGAPEIDIIEGEVDTNIRVGVASQSMQIAPMDIWYMPDYNWVEVHNSSVTTMNTYAGGPFQQAVSAITTLNTDWYNRGEGERYFQKYAFEYLNDDNDGYVRWFVGNDPTLTVYANALAPNGNIGWRQISKEPMSMVVNMGISKNWAYIDFPSIPFPVTFEIDSIRIYQPSDAISTTCDPEDYPTYDYINDHPLAYQNWNNTLWNMTGYSKPGNTLVGCKDN
ncbi:beta-glucan synthesis-associated protein [Pichia kluyveri]|uniref:Beta-glucan synthesis-associated protein n=1 Tax=Pichia kluyveri TaxID=36015 RepID=A0AAV5R3J6_PICKL|nr:beta-glucan synthesis-associated protein [Pichia kluyveri]